MLVIIIGSLFVVLIAIFFVLVEVDKFE